ncbi:MAG: aldose 1-epimerase family protein [Planctomycetes bacterium]|nr:aldose 1-epimerase family protein [Planctomycetota bacterium]
MKIGNRDYTREELLRRVGNPAQLGGTRHYTLSDGRSKNVAAIDVDTGGGFRFTVLPDRGLDISLASYKGLKLVYLTPNGEVHPAFYEPEGMGWLRTFFGGLLTTCGLTYLGAPGFDEGQQLGLHGRYAASPARRVCDRSGWDGDEYRVEISGVVEECAVFGDKIRLTRTITTSLGSKALTICDVAENFGYATSPFTVLYHVNAGFPLLDASARLSLTAQESFPLDETSAAGFEQWPVISEPIPDFAEQNFLHTMACGQDGLAAAVLINRELLDGLGLYIRFDPRELPYLNQWKMMGEGDYVMGIEPCNAPCAPRAELRSQGLLPVLEPGQSRTNHVEIGVLDGEEEIDRFLKQMKSA